MNRHRAIGFARIVVGMVFVTNVWCALAFIVDPETFADSFELSGLPGRVVIQSFGILFLMWNATYPIVLLDPITHRALFRIVIFQQAIGVIGETWLILTLPAGHPALWATGLRFIVFDGLGLVAMGIAYLMLSRREMAGKFL